MIRHNIIEIMSRIPVFKEYFSVDEMVADVGEFIFHETNALTMQDLEITLRMCCNAIEHESDTIMFEGLKRIVEKRVKLRMVESN